MTKTFIQPEGMAEAVGPFSRAVLIDDHLHIRIMRLWLIK